MHTLPNLLQDPIFSNTGFGGKAVCSTVPFGAEVPHLGQLPKALPPAAILRSQELSGFGRIRTAGVADWNLKLSQAVAALTHGIKGHGSRQERTKTIVQDMEPPESGVWRKRNCFTSNGAITVEN